ncbi:MAG: hypothetical protein M1365_00290 [Actinobacteria bacterium]|nr:hypothetical protein [Actinomycetota bacterium]
MNYLKTIPLLILGLYLLVSYLPQVLASSQSISTKVRIPVCGDLVGEDPEQCDNNDLRGNTCNSLGYGTGTLTCDIACDFITTACPTLVPTAVPTPTLTPTVIPTPTVVSATTTTKESSVTAQNSPTVVPTESPFIPISFSNILRSVTRVIPQSILIYDTNMDGKIKKTEVFPVVKEWVRQWAEVASIFNSYSEQDSQQTSKVQEYIKKNDQIKCDINKDNICNLFDLSVLLYYIEE